jgi:hypothetical protein
LTQHSGETRIRRRGSQFSNESRKICCFHSLPTCRNPAVRSCRGNISSTSAGASACSVTSSAELRWTGGITHASENSISGSREATFLRRRTNGELTTRVVEMFCRFPRLAAFPAPRNVSAEGQGSQRHPYGARSIVHRLELSLN